jgi:hypothetical protein
MVKRSQCSAMIIYDAYLLTHFHKGCNDPPRLLENLFWHNDFNFLGQRLIGKIAAHAVSMVNLTAKLLHACERTHLEICVQGAQFCTFTTA